MKQAIPIVRRTHFRAVCAGAVLLFSAAVVERLLAQHPAQAGVPASITVDYPPRTAIIPPDLSPIAFRWRDTSAGAAWWRVEIEFADGSAPVVVTTQGDRLRVGEIDRMCVSEMNELPVLTPEESAGHIWRPDADTWEAIKRHSREQDAAIAITGFTDRASRRPVSVGRSMFRTSADAVGAPIFYRDVPLIPSQANGQLGILPKDALKYVKWRLRDIAETRSRIEMENLPTCANCHSFSADGRTIGIDVDGPMNDKSLYAAVPLRQETVINTRDVFKWNTSRDDQGGRKLRAGFMSQVSPDGRYILTTLDERDPQNLARAYGLEEKYYFAVYRDYRFGQVFFPTRGVLAWREVATGRTQPLPGADDPRYVQTDGVWSRDGKWIVFAKAEAKTAFPRGAPAALFANDPKETQIQYNLYRMPFNEGRGGTPEPIAGASFNGMSNSFPKITPDSRWIVFVQCRNGQLMRPDSRLFIVPFKGGEARLMRCNTPLMNSWHSFSPNGRWMVFASKARSPYTQLYLTHLDRDGNDSPPILIEDSTAANRAANIPEFVNIAPGDFAKLEIPASEFYQVFDLASDLLAKGKTAEALPEWRKAVDLDPDDEKARVNLGFALDREGLTDEAIEQYRKAIDIAPEHASAYDNLAGDLLQRGRLDEAIEAYTADLALQSRNALAQTNLATALYQRGRIDEAIEHGRQALEVDPTNTDAHNTLGLALWKQDRLDEAIGHFQTAVAAKPDSLPYQNNLARVLAQRGRFDEAIPHMERAVALSNAQEPVVLSLLAAMYAEVGRFPDAVASARQALDLAERGGDQKLADTLNRRIATYRDRISVGSSLAPAARQ